MIFHSIRSIPKPRTLKRSVLSRPNHTMSAPRTIVIPAAKKPQRATIICLHGLGDSGAGWSFLAENWRRRGKFEDVAFIFPSAPPIPITVNGGMHMPGWYDIIAFDSLNRSDDEAGIMRSRSYIHSLINDQVKDGIPAERVILGGFSQGGAMSLFSGLTFPQRLGGVFGLSCYQLLDDKFTSLRDETGNHKPSVFMGHGDADPLVRVQWGRQTRDRLRDRGLDVNWNEYPGLPHSADPAEIDALEAWVAARMADDKDEAKV